MLSHYKDVDALYKLYQRQPDCRQQIEDLILEQPLVLMNIKVHRHHKVPTITTLRHLIFLAGLVPDIIEDLYEEFTKKYKQIWVNYYGLTTDPEQVMYAFTIIDYNDKVPNKVIWKYIRGPFDDCMDFIGELANP
jgi:hypothetical protein